MAIFNFPFHKVATEYPESSFRANFGNSYQYSAAPSAPDQRKFKLKFSAMKYFSNVGIIDKVTFPEFNLGLLEDFYLTHKLHYTFIYPHPVYGNVPCRFNRPLAIPEGETDGGGLVRNIEIELIEVPGLGSSAESDLIQITYVSLPT